ncbi:phosphoglycerate dehydrogenase-like enzyme [Kineosphaera limosa]|nr:hydroxyacid dehydrogenase [Kineosphaera limosa]NYE00764.1 phosphoglycerate dehydrogenase-like enzyme [Kineosphaera limosa]
MAPTVWEEFSSPGVEARLRGLVATPDGLDPLAVVQDIVSAPDLADVEVLLTGWGTPHLGPEILARMPRLRAVIHTAGSVKHLVSDACWERGLVVSSAVEENAIPVGEYTLAAILFAQKRVLETSRLYRQERGTLPWAAQFESLGNYGRVVGIVGASRIGRRVIELLRPFDMRVLLSDPYVDAAEARRLGVELVELDELVARSDTVSLHAPDLPQTRHLIDERRLGLMRTGSVLINTARGALVDTDALTAELVSGRLHAVIDVTEPEVLPAESPLYDLPNVLLTPHIAGSLGGELARLVDHALDELERYGAGLGFTSPVQRELLNQSA